MPGHLTQVLVLRREQPNKDEPSRSQVWHHVRSSLRLIMEMSAIGDGTTPRLIPSRLTKSRLAALTRVMGGCPMIAFMDLAAFRLDELLSKLRPRSDTSPLPEEVSQDVDADIKLLHFIPAILRRYSSDRRGCTRYIRSQWREPKRYIQQRRRVGVHAIPQQRRRGQRRSTIPAHKSIRRLRVPWIG